MQRGHKNGKIRNKNYGPGHSVIDFTRWPTVGISEITNTDIMDCKKSRYYRARSWERYQDGTT